MKEYTPLEKLLDLGRKIIPKSIFEFAQPIYHYFLAITGSLLYRFPGKNLIVIGVTGTKGKSTTTELINSILEAAGKKTAVANTIRYKIGESEWPNTFKMTLRGRFFTQSFLRRAVDDGCEYAILEISSEGVRQFRHKFLSLNALIFTNLAPEHIESHGSYENYIKAKLSIAKELETSSKDQTVIIANIDDKEGEHFLALNVKNKIPYSLNNAFNIKTDEKGSSFQVDKTVYYLQLPGIFNVQNSLGAIACAKYFGIGAEDIKKGLENIQTVRGRMEKINLGQTFEVVVDYAHTPDSLRAVYTVYKDHHTVCILGNTGGGRDKWKRPEMGRIADKYCSEIILTNEDPYDENPMTIIEEVKAGIQHRPCEIIIDRRAAIRTALSLAKHRSAEYKEEEKKVAVLITGKGTDPYIMGENGKRQKWDDATVAREELTLVLNN